MVGAVAGAIVGAAGGAAAGHMINPEAEDAYWREQHSKQPYAQTGRSFEEYQPAYRTGYQGYDKYGGTQQSFEGAEAQLREEYLATGATLPWEEAREACRAGWMRVHSGDAVRVPISEEQVTIGKREVGAGEVRIRKEVHTEVVNEPVELKREEIVVERVAATGEPVPEEAFREGEVKIPLKREEPVVAKTAKVVGEVEIRKGTETERKDVSETARKEEVKVEEHHTEERK